MAACWHNVGLATALIGVGAQLDVQDVSGKTALMFSTLTDHKQIALALIDAPAQLDVHDKAGNTASDRTIFFFERLDLIKLG